MPRFRPNIVDLSPYLPGRRIEEVAADIGVPPERIVKLASNESPDGPFPGAVEAARAALVESNRYPDNDMTELASALAKWLALPEDNLWFGNGSVSLLGHIGLAVGGPGTSVVYAWPSFVMYRVVSRWAMSEVVEVALDPSHVHHLERMRDAIRSDTTAVYVCNPNNPTGTVVPGEKLAAFIDSVPEEALVVVDEAYHDFATRPDYRSALDLAVTRPNVVLLRTFSKIFALASLRVGYAVARPELITELRKAQAPFSVSQPAQAAAAASLADRDEYRRRVEANRSERTRVTQALADRGVEHTESQANFVYFRLGEDSPRAGEGFTNGGVIIRPMSGGWLRVTLGAPEENDLMISVLDRVRLDLG